MGLFLKVMFPFLMTAVTVGFVGAVITCIREHEWWPAYIAAILTAVAITADVVLIYDSLR